MDKLTGKPAVPFKLRDSGGRIHLLSDYSGSLRGLIKGVRIRKSEGDIYQRGGDVLIDPNGIVSLHHIGTGPADRPTVESLLRRLPPA